MCHVLLLLPLLALPLFFFLPLSLALPIYASVAAVAAAVYWGALQAMKQPIVNGAQGMIGSVGEAIEERDGVLLVRVNNEIWRAVPVGSRSHGSGRMRVVGAENLVLSVQELAPDAGSAGKPGGARGPCRRG